MCYNGLFVKYQTAIVAQYLKLKQTREENMYGDRYDEGISWITILIFSGAGLAILAWLSTSIVIVRQKTAKVIEVFGKFSSVKNAGLNLKLPFPIASVADEVSLQIRELKEDIVVKAADNAFLKVPVKVQFRVIQDKVEQAYYELADPESQIKSYIVNTVRSKANTMDMDQIFKSKNEFEGEVETSLKKTFEGYGYEIVNVLVDDPQPSDELRKAFDKVLAAQREKDAAQNLADAKRIKMVGEANAEAESLTIKGKAFKTFRADIADGNSEAIKSFLKDIEGLEARDVLNFFAGVDTRDAIRDASANPGTLIVVPANYAGDDGRSIALVKALMAETKN
ncbi:MAG: SPFH domain/Band 7 family protein [Candidatus Moranbacteria bacterium GW2011_GWE1_49_15]|nr:MAG: SPFH domain/Band 7 family protein [Candidatus Moranbacteria bacterium GW2011_GWE2_47_10]KKW07196.1 MAG: SPFH domain/Band 7 family protein [Candidatus Moranbacteria bacterium GW2011_GWE1_49_15]HBP00773.1 hypothetical protein [Candidatus Moranbacteria bacterium]